MYSNLLKKYKLLDKRRVQIAVTGVVMSRWVRCDFTSAFSREIPGMHYGIYFLTIQQSIFV